MFSRKPIFGLSILIVACIGGLSSLGAAYFKSDFFPIGLTGLGYTGASTPYGKGWENERGLIDTLGITCIGCEDAWRNYLIDFAGERTDNTYIEEVLPQLVDSAGNPTVYLITASYGAASKRFDKNIIFKYTEANL